jgi:hypothetical protein
MFIYGQIVYYHGFKCVFYGIREAKNYRYANLHMAKSGTLGFNVPESKWGDITPVALMHEKTAAT